MSIFRIIAIFGIFIFSVPAGASDSIYSDNGKLTVVRNGTLTHVRASDREEITNRILDVFNSNSSDTSQIWYKQAFEQDGKSVKEKWAHYKSKSFFSVTFEKEEEDVQEEMGDDEGGYYIDPDAVDIAEIIQTFSENKNGSFMGVTMARLRDGEVRAYRVNGKDLINLYCLDQATKYLPEHYKMLAKKYSAPEYEDSGIICTADKKN